MNRSRRRRLALRVLAVALGMGLLGWAGVALADDSGSTPGPGDTVIAPTTTVPGLHTIAPADTTWN